LHPYQTAPKDTIAAAADRKKSQWRKGVVKINLSPGLFLLGERFAGTKIAEMMVVILNPNRRSDP